MGKRIWFLLLVLLLILAGYFVGYTVQVIQPTVVSVAELKVQSILSQKINEAAREKFEEEPVAEELIHVFTDADGKVSSVSANTTALNRLAADMTWRIHSKMNELEEERVEVPVGAVLGSSLLSQVGPSFQLKIIPLGTAKVNYKTEIETAGINQTKHKVYLQVDSTCKILAPFTIKNVKLQNQILVAETIIVGDVPQSYIVVPEEHILDAID